MSAVQIRLPPPLEKKTEVSKDQIIENKFSTVIIAMEQEDEDAGVLDSRLNLENCIISRRSNNFWEPKGRKKKLFVIEPIKN